MESSRLDVTGLLSELTRGNQEAAEKLIPLVYPELKRIARSYMRRERPDHTLQTTALVHEAYLKLVGQKAPNWKGRSHFFGIAAQLMRRILIDHARGHLREKRGGAKEVLPLNEALAFSAEHSEELVELDEALNFNDRSASGQNCGVAVFRGFKRRGNLGIPQCFSEDSEARLGCSKSLATR